MLRGSRSSPSTERAAWRRTRPRAAGLSRLLLHVHRVRAGLAAKERLHHEKYRRAGLKIMVGAMVETRLGLTAMAHVARALGQVDFVDLDTALLLKWDPFAGGYSEEGPRLTLEDSAGFGVIEAPPTA